MTDSGTTLDDLLAAIRSTSTTAALGWAHPPTALTGGFWAQMWRIRLSGAPEELSGDLVARVMPDPVVAERETIVQAGLARAGFPTPAVRLAAGPGAQLDKAWMIMDFAPGQPLLSGLSGPAALIRLPKIARAMPYLLATHAADLHRIDPGELLEALGSDDGAGELLGRLSDNARQLAAVDLVSLADWLRTHRPRGEVGVVCHGDLHPFNILTDPSGDTVVDWSSAQIAHPTYDLAFTSLLLSHPPLVAPRPLRPVVNLIGKALGRRFLRSYEAAAHTTIDSAQFEWFTSLHALRILTEIATWVAQGELADRSNHPFLALRQPLRAQLATATGINIAPAVVGFDDGA